MAVIETPEGCENIRIHRLKGGIIVNVKKAVRVDRITVFVGDDGKLYCDCVNKVGYYMLGRWPWNTPLMKALHRLKVITKKQHNKHLALVEKGKAYYRRRYAAKEILENAEAAGIKLSASDLRKLRRLTK